MRILIAEDHEALARLVPQGLEAKPYAVDVFSRWRTGSGRGRRVRLRCRDSRPESADAGPSQSPNVVAVYINCSAAKINHSHSQKLIHTVRAGGYELSGASCPCAGPLLCDAQIGCPQGGKVPINS